MWEPEENETGLEGLCLESIRTQAVFDPKIFSTEGYVPSGEVVVKLDR